MKSSHKYTKIIFVYLFTILVMTITTGCIINSETIENVDNHLYSAKEDFFHTLSVYGYANFVLEGINGTVEINTQANLDSVVIQGERIVESESIADAEEHLQYLNVDISYNADIMKVKTTQPSQSNGRNYKVNYQVTIPDNWNVHVEQLNGNVALSGITGDIGVILTNGNISMNNCEGDIQTTLTNGNTTLSDITGNVWNSIVNGNSTGQIAIPDSGICQQTIVNGNIILSIPQTTSARFSAKTTSGLVNVNNLILNNAQITNMSVTGTMGSGSGNVALEIVNGGINVNGY